MNALILAALILSSDCELFGHLYEQAAILRDAGAPREQVIARAREAESKKALERVFNVPAMTPRDWRYFASGICTAYEAQKETRL